MSKRSVQGYEETATRQKLPSFLTKPDSSIFLTGSYVVLDFETSNITFGDPCNGGNSIVLASYYSSKSRRTRTVIGNEYEMGELLTAVREVDFIVAQNAKFELGWLKRCGLDLTTIIAYCTMVGRYVEAGNIPCKKDLDSLSDYYGIGIKKRKHVSNLIKLGVNPKELPTQWLKDYCEQDVLETRLVFLLQRQVLQEQNLLNVMYLRSLWLPCLADIESNGTFLDKKRVYKIFEDYEHEYIELERRFTTFTGGVNQNSPKQLSEYIYGQLGFRELTDKKGNPLRTKADKQRTDKETIVGLSASSKAQREFIGLFGEIKRVGGKLSKYLSKMRDCCDNSGGVLYASFNPATTKTHRLSSTGKEHKIQYQNMDRELKPVFTARNKGWFVGEADEAQLEFRVATFLGQDKKAMEDINNDVDVHQFTADTLTEAGQETNRQDAKSRTFKPLFGGSSGTKAEQTYYAAFKAKYYQIAATQRAWIETVLREKELTLPNGFKAYWPNTYMHSSGYIENTTVVYNLPVQHFSTAEIVPIAVTYLWHRMKQAGMESFLVNTVHDSAIGEIHPEEVELFTELAVKSMVGDVYDYLMNMYGIDFNVPLDAEVTIGTHWAEKKGWSKKWLG